MTRLYIVAVPQPSNTTPANVIVFARTPIHGQVKKRLALSVGDGVALETYRQLLEITLLASHQAVTRLENGVLWWCHLGPSPGEESLSGRAVRAVPQTGSGIAENLNMALDMWGQGVAGSKVLVMGADHPTINNSHIVEMIDLLDDEPVCLGPAPDGGFWCIGTTIPLGRIMDGVPLGTDRALTQLKAALTQTKQTFAEGPDLWDVDTAEDLQRWRALAGRKKT